jgi:hypothetical protein
MPKNGPHRASHKAGQEYSKEPTFSSFRARKCPVQRIEPNPKDQHTKTKGIRFRDHAPQSPVAIAISRPAIGMLIKYDEHQGHGTVSLLSLASS